jgi:hypothetical protein
MENKQIQINCPYLRASTLVKNGVHTQVIGCADISKVIDPNEYCAGDKCRFVNIEKKTVGEPNV